MREDTVKAIEEWLAGLSSADRDLAVARLASDGRQGVQRALARFLARVEAEEKERARLATLFLLEKEAQAAGYSLVAGVDEVGRGPLAGPVVAAAVILPPDFFLPGLNDSKKLAPEKREWLYERIRSQAVAYGVGLADPEFIDRHNILQATFWAMTQAVRQLAVRPDLILVDGGFTIRQLPFPQRAVVKGDALSASIAAASILAKVTRDRLMVEYDRLFPQYGFAENKGYGTAAHLAALSRYGPCPLHRRSFSWEVAVSEEKE